MEERGLGRPPRDQDDRNPPASEPLPPHQCSDAASVRLSRCGVGEAPPVLELSKGQERITMKATQLLHNLGQSLWLDNITRDLLDRGTLQRYIDDLSVTGLTSNP